MIYNLIKPGFLLGLDKVFFSLFFLLLLHVYGVFGAVTVAENTIRQSMPELGQSLGTFLIIAQPQVTLAFVYKFHNPSL